MNKRFRILLADDHKIFLEGLSEVLDRENDFEIVKLAKCGNDVMDYLRKEAIDLAVLDLSMPNKDGFQTTIEIKEKFKDVKVIILSMHEQGGFIKNAIYAGADWYLLKTVEVEELIKAMRYTLDGETYFSQKVTRKIIGKYKNDENDHIIKLNKKEREIIKLMAEGLTSKEISVKISMSTHSVNTYRKNMIDKFKVKNGIQMIIEAYKRGYIIS